MKKHVLLLLLSLISISVRADIIVEMAKLSTLMKSVSFMYVDTVDLHSITEQAIKDVLKNLDPHSAYLPAEELKQANEQLDGNFEGIGIQFQVLEDTLNVVQTISGCPAEKVGVMPGDKIIYVEDSLIAGVGVKNKTIQRLLRGPKGSVVVVKILRQGEQELIDFSITRDRIPIYTVDAGYMVDKRIGYIKINSFGAKTHEEFMTKWHYLKKKGATKLIIDLQGNGGGYLKSAFDIANELLSDGMLVVYTEGVHLPRQNLVATGGGELEKIPVVVLTDEYSASASEIVSGAIQDWDRGLIIGRRTFGKGLVQRQFDMPDGSAIRLTTSRYYTPSGRCIQKPYKGVDYQKDLENRYKHGEFVSADSIHFPDSLRYQTLVKKRVVYGGGGIMPDIFVPADTLRYSLWYRKVVAKGIVNKICTHYIQEHRQEMLKAYPTIDKYIERFEVPTSLVTEMITRAGEAEIEFDQQQFAQSEPYIYLQLKALIARDLWSMQEYYQVYNKVNDALNRAISELNK